MKTKQLILMTLAIFCLIMSSCEKDAQENLNKCAPQAQNGLNYKLIGYIGPDSCELYRCYVAENNDACNIHSIYMTRCKDIKASSLKWRSGKVNVQNEITYEKDTSRYQIVIKHVSKTFIVPETSYVKTK